MGDNEHPILVVDCPAQTVYTIEEKELVNHRLPDKPKGKNVLSFDKFIAMEKAEA
jgi:hypothetical protein